MLEVKIPFILSMCFGVAIGILVIDYVINKYKYERGNRNV